MTASFRRLRFQILRAAGIVFAVLAILFFIAFWVGTAPPSETVLWGANFSQKQAAALGLDWKQAYRALLDELGARRLRIATYWDLMEPRAGAFQFDDVDWQLREAGERSAKVVLAVGMKTPRWPECHIPGWAASLSKEKQRKEILALLQAVVARYRSSPAIEAWQVENEPFFAFGDCPWYDSAFLAQEAAVVKKLDPARPVVITDSGEWSSWITAARYGDIVGTTLYRRVWFSPLQTYVTYPFSPLYYARRTWFIETFFHKPVWDVELQAEPWSETGLANTSPAESEKTMNPAYFREMLDFARRSGQPRAYLWGAEWWYYLKIRGSMEYWDSAKALFHGLS